MVAPVHKINSPQVVVTVEIVVAEEEELLAGEAEEVDVVMVVVNKGSNSSRRSHQIPRSTKEETNPQSVKFVGSLATQQISVGTGRHRLVVIHLGVVSNSPEVEIEVHTGQAVVHKDVEEGSSLQWLMNSHME